jgi:tetratricopeptide (TPR) repeat protein
MKHASKKVRYGAMAATIVIAVDAFLLAQRFALIPGPWSQKAQLAYGSSSVSLYTAAIDGNPGDYMTYYRRGTLYQQQRRFDLALADFNQAVKLSPRPVGLAALGVAAGDSASRDTHTLELVFLLHRTRAEVLEQMNRPEEALADLDKAIALDPRGPDVFFTRGILRELTGRYDAAIADFDVILARRSSVEWYFARGLAKYFKGDWNDASNDFAQAAQRSPENETYWIWLAKAQLRTGQPLHTESFAALDRQSGAWTVIESLMTDHTPEQFISGVRAGADYANPGNQASKCKTALFLGEWLTLRKAGAGARDMFSEAEATCLPLTIERSTALAELQRLTPS